MEKPVDILGTGNIKDIVKWVLIALAVAVVGFFVWKFIKKQKSKELQKALDSTTTTNQGGKNVSVNLGSIAGAINDAFHHYYGGMAEDEERAIMELLNCPKQLIPQLSEVYYKISDGRGLKQDFIAYLDADEYARVRSQFS